MALRQPTTSSFAASAAFAPVEPGARSSVFGHSFVSGPALGDTALFADLTKSIREEAARAVINKHQCANAARRLGDVARMLRRLPDPRPTPQLIAVFQSADYLLKLMSRRPLWARTLREEFLCRGRFAALRERLRAVWHLHPTGQWEEEDRAAATLDERPNAEMLLATTPATPGIAALLRHDSNNNNNEEEEDGGGGGAERRRHCDPNAGTGGGCDDIIAFYRRHQLGAWRLRYEDLERITDLCDHATLAAGAAHDDAHPFTPEVARRREPPPAPGRKRRPGARSPSSSCVACEPYSDGAAGAGCFLLDKGFLYDGRPVVVEMFTPSREHFPSAHTVNAFVQDAVARSRWCHPGLVTYCGAFTERFLTRAREAALYAAAVEEEEPTFPLCPIAPPPLQLPLADDNDDGDAPNDSLSGAPCVFSNASSPSPSRRPHSRSHSHQHLATPPPLELHRRSPDVVAAATAPPTMALGLISDDITFAADGMDTVTDGTADGSDGGGEERAEEEAAAAAAGRGGSLGRPPRFGAAHTPVPPACAAHAPLRLPAFVSLHELVFVEQERFSLVESIDVVATLADAVQYILLDQADVPEEVYRAWLTLSPTRIYVAAAGAAAAGGGPLHTSNGTSTGDTSAQPRSPALPLGKNPFMPPPGGVEDGALAEEREGAGEATSAEDPYSAFSGADAQSPTSRLGSVLVTPQGSPLLASGRYHHRSRAASAGAAPSFETAATFTMPTVAVARQDDAGALCRSREPVPPPSPQRHAPAGLRPPLLATVSSLPIRTRAGVAVRYAPPVFDEARQRSRWAPHPRCVSPPCYALAQLLLALVTGLVPYRRHNDAQVDRLLLEASKDADAAAAGGGSGGWGTYVDVRPGLGPGLTIPQAVPLPLRVLLRLAMSLRPLVADDYRVSTHLPLHATEARGTSSNSSTAAKSTVNSTVSSRRGNAAGQDGGLRLELTGSMTAAAAAAAATAEEEEEDCAYLLQRLQATSSNTRRTSSAVFADSTVEALPYSTSTATAAVPRAMTMAMFLEGLAVVAEQLVLRRGASGVEMSSLSSTLLNRSPLLDSMRGDR